MCIILEPTARGCVVGCVSGLSASLLNPFLSFQPTACILMHLPLVYTSFYTSPTLPASLPGWYHLPTALLVNFLRISYSALWPCHMFPFDLHQFCTYRLGLFGARFSLSIASFQYLMRPISPSGSEDMEVLVAESSFFVSERYPNIRCTSSSCFLTLNTTRSYLPNAPKIA
jgi:hypothetical protein